MYIGSITSRDLNHLPHDSHYDVLTTTLNKGCNSQRGEMIYEECGDHRGRTVYALFFYFPADGSTNPDVF